MAKIIGDGRYKDYSWLFNELITLGKTEKQVAAEQKLKLRLIVKWAGIHHLGENGFAKLKTLSSKQTELIKASLLGDGHISDHIFIVSHCEKQKDYLYWKYDVLKDVCKSPPSYYPGGEAIFKGKAFNRSPSYRFNTRKLDQLGQLGSIPKTELIRNLTEFGLSVWILDDGYRGPNNWELCLGNLDDDAKKQLALKMSEYGLEYKRRTDPRYIRFNSLSSKKIDQIILANIPDIVRYKVIERR